MNSVLLINKPPSLTSHDVVNRVRRILQQRSVGHLGTLDPLATGVLPLVIGNLTRLAQFYTDSEKIYEGVIRFGFATDTYDADGEPIGAALTVKVSLEEVRELAARFRGVIQQMPPPFSAKKIRGVPAYKLARKHKEVPLTPVQVEIKEFEILGLSDVAEEDVADKKSLPADSSEKITQQGTRARFRARVASGTYMRSVAHDMGQLLGCGAHLESLRRTSVAEFDLRDAHRLEEVDAAAREGRVEDLFVHPRSLLPHLPAVTADEESAARIRAGRTVNLPEMSQARLVKVFYGQRELIAIATRVAGTLFHAKIVLAGDFDKQLVDRQTR
ncbi:MAG: tRNA pseudouridine(55) synthase TruB [Acidobacteria bacterium]|nr:MAG: tRNA pseudouridine(55) synthase TruB [Acidobacteriota bacterium]